MSDNSAKSLERLLSEKRLARVADPSSLERGYVYFAEGRVQSVRFERYGVRATVQGTSRYQVSLWEEQGELEYSCSCPIGQSRFCKHCVATGLAWLKRGKKRVGSDPGSADIRAYLAALPVERLVDMVMAGADLDERLFRKLSLAAGKAAGSLDLAHWRREIDQAVGDLEAVGFEGVGEAKDRLDGLLDELDALVKEGNAALVLELFDYLLDATEDLLEASQDAEGEIFSIAERMESLHQEACEKVRPDPETLAAWLFEKEIDCWCSFGLAAYTELLGPAGVAAYRRLAEAAWDKLPALRPGEHDPNQSSRDRLTEIMEDLARQSGDLEQWVAVQSRDLSRLQPFISIAGAYRKAGQCERALEWAERGWHAFGEPRSPVIRELLADLLQENGRKEEAIAFAWQPFAEQPGLHRFQFLKRYAGNGSDWRAWREKALDLIRALIWENEKPRSVRDRKTWHSVGLWDDHSVLVEILLWDGDAETAWAEARKGGCRPSLWLELAAVRERTHPLDAVAIYRDRMPSLLAGTDQQAYATAVDLLARIKKLLIQCKKEQDLVAFVAEVRSVHSRKRKLLAMLDARGL